MASKTDLEDRDREVLAGFLAEHPHPVASDVREWTRRHPHLADAILALAIDLNRITAFGVNEPSSEPTEEELEAGWRRHRAAAQAIDAEMASSPRLSALAEAARTDLADLADAIVIDRRILIALDAGRILLPVSGRLVAALANALKTLNETVAAALHASYLAPRIAFAKADGTPSMRRRRYVDVVRESDMSDERKTFWIGTD